MGSGFAMGLLGLLVSALCGGATDLLDALPTETYWQISRSR